MKYKFKADLLLKPQVVFPAMLIGVLIGVFFKGLAGTLAPFGKLYMALLGMCITPLLIVSISSSIAGLIRNHKLSGQLQKIAIYFPGAMLAAVILGTVLGYIVEPGNNLSEVAQESIGKLMLSQSDAPLKGSESAGIMSLLKMMIPPNIFTALSNGNNLAVLFFSVILGISLGRTSHKKAEDSIDFLQVMYEAFSNMINGIMYGLPLGLLCLFADHISHVGPGIVFAIGKFILVCFLGGFIIIAFSWIVIKRRLKCSWKELYIVLKEPSVVAIATGSSLASIPSILQSFENNSKLGKDSIHLFVPLSICLSAIGASFAVAITAVYMMNLYSIPMTFGNLMITVVGSVFSGVAMSGAPGVGALAMFSIVMTPLGIPLEPTILISIASLPLTESIITLSNVTANMALVSSVAIEESS